MNAGSLLLVLLTYLCSGDAFLVACIRGRGGLSPLNGFMDAMNKALANDPSLPPPTNPGMNKAAEPVLVEFIVSKKQVKAFPGQKISMIAQAAGEKIKYSCKKGECGTCEINFNGKIVKACQSSLPSITTVKKYSIGIPQK